MLQRSNLLKTVEQDSETLKRTFGNDANLLFDKFKLETYRNYDIELVCVDLDKPAERYKKLQ